MVNIVNTDGAARTQAGFIDFAGPTGNNSSARADVTYSAKGVEFKGGIQRGPLSLTAGATYTAAEIVEAEEATLVGNTPPRQPDIIFQLGPSTTLIASRSAPASSARPAAKPRTANN